MSINETVKSFLLHKHHEFAEKTRIGRAAERIWVKHQFKERGLLNPKNYSQKEMGSFYNIVARNYVYLHQTFPQPFSTNNVYDSRILGLEPGKNITHAELYLQRVLGKTRTVEFKDILSSKTAAGVAFSTGMIVDPSKTEARDNHIINFYRNGEYLTDPNCPPAFASILKDSSVSLARMLGVILATKETREEFVSNPRGFIESKLGEKGLSSLTPVQQESVFAMTSPTFVEAVKSNEKYLESVNARVSEQRFEEATAHEAYHLGMRAASENILTNETLKESYEKTDYIAGIKSHPASPPNTEPVQSANTAPNLMEIAREMAHDRALDEIYIDTLASRSCNTYNSLNTVYPGNGSNFYYFNGITSSGYTINEPIFNLLENMVAFTDGSTIAMQNYFANLVPTSREEERELLPGNPLFDEKTSAFNLVGKNGKINLPSQFKNTIKEPRIFSITSPFRTFCALTNNILDTRQSAPDIRVANNTIVMVEQVQEMLFQSFNGQVANLAGNVADMFHGIPSTNEMVEMLQQVTAKEEIVQAMFSSLILQSDPSKDTTEGMKFINETYGKEATFKSVFQSPKTVEEIQALIDNGIIVQTPLLTTYMTTLSNMQSIREIVETGVLTENPNLTTDQLLTLLDISNPSPYAQMDEIEQTVVTDLGLSLETTLETENLLTGDMGQVDANGTLTTDASAVSNGGKVEIATTSSDLSAGGGGLGMDMGSCDIGG